MAGTFFDSNEDGKLSFSEFLVAYIITSEFFRKQLRSRRDIQTVMFAAMDTDGSGTVSLPELTQFIHIGACLGVARNTSTPKQVAAEWMAKFDTDNNGEIDFKEFCALEQRAISYHGLTKSRSEYLKMKQS